MEASSSISAPEGPGDSAASNETSAQITQLNDVVESSDRVLEQLAELLASSRKLSTPTSSPYNLVGISPSQEPENDGLGPTDRPSPVTPTSEQTADKSLSRCFRSKKERRESIMFKPRAVSFGGEVLLGSAPPSTFGSASPKQGGTQPTSTVRSSTFKNRLLSWLKTGADAEGSSAAEERHYDTSSQGFSPSISGPECSPACAMHDPLHDHLYQHQLVQQRNSFEDLREEHNRQTHRSTVPPTADHHSNPWPLLRTVTDTVLAASPTAAASTPLDKPHLSLQSLQRKCTADLPALTLPGVPDTPPQQLSRHPTPRKTTRSQSTRVHFTIPETSDFNTSPLVEAVNILAANTELHWLDSADEPTTLDYLLPHPSPPAPQSPTSRFISHAGAGSSHTYRRFSTCSSQPLSPTSARPLPGAGPPPILAAKMYARHGSTCTEYYRHLALTGSVSCSGAAPGRAMSVPGTPPSRQALGSRSNSLKHSTTGALTPGLQQGSVGLPLSSGQVMIPGFSGPSNPGGGSTVVGTKYVWQ